MKFKLTPDKETLQTNIIERTIGRAVGIEPATQPFGDASADLLGDVFHALYNSDMKPLEDKDAPVDRRVNHALMKWMAKDKANRYFWVEISIKRTVIGGTTRLLAIVRDRTTVPLAAKAEAEPQPQPQPQPEPVYFFLLFFRWSSRQ
jgi:hypothetical protein